MRGGRPHRSGRHLREGGFPLGGARTNPRNRSLVPAIAIGTKRRPGLEDPGFVIRFRSLPTSENSCSTTFVNKGKKKVSFTCGCCSG